VPPGDDITQLLSDLNAGKTGAEEALLPLVYDELHALARHYMKAEGPGHTLQTTALVHEAYLRLAGDQLGSYNDKTHYMRLAARVMRRVLIDYARRKRAQKKGGGWQKCPLEMVDGFEVDSSIDLLVLDEALEKLAEMDPQLCELVELRYFGGLTVEESAQVLKVSSRTVKSSWKMAKVWLKQQIA